MQAAALTVRAVQQRFTADILPLVLRRVRLKAWYFACPGRRDDFEQDAVLHAWVDFRRLVDRGLADTVPAKSIAYLAVLRAKVGRHPQGGPQRGYAIDRDALSWRTQRRVGFVVEGKVEAAAQPASQRRRAGIPELVGIRVDFLRWATAQPARDQVAMRALAGGDKPLEVARRMGHSPAWVSIGRQRWLRSWHRFNG